MGIRRPSLSRRKAAYIRRVSYLAYRRLQNAWARFCASHPWSRCCAFGRWLQRWSGRVRDWIGCGAKRIGDQRFKSVHMLVWLVAAVWLTVEAVFLVDANFPFIRLDTLFRSYRRHHHLFDLVMTHVRPVAMVMVLTWMREMANEWFRLRQDSVRATWLIKYWFTFLAIFGFTCALLGHRLKMTDSATETSLFLLMLQVMKWWSRRFDPQYGGKRTDMSPRAKKTYSVINAVLKLLVRRAGK